MADDLQRMNGALMQAKDDLELRVAERTQELSVALAQLRELSAYSEQVREEERTRIAREVHDELGSLLVALKMDVNWLGKRLSQNTAVSPEQIDLQTRMQNKCQSMGSQIERAVDNVGRIITDLRPSILDHQGLWAALEWQAHEFAHSAELVLEWDMRVGKASEPPEVVAMAVFRIFQEMLSNVGRHAKASRINIAIVVQDQSLYVRVADDGSGASANAFEASTAYGVMGMRERARHLAGQLRIESSLGQGTVCELNIPLAWESQ